MINLHRNQLGEATMIKCYNEIKNKVNNLLTGPSHNNQRKLDIFM